MSDQTKPISRRRRLIILPDLQKKLIRQCIMWPIATIAVVALLVGITWQRFVSETAEADLGLGASGFLMAALAGVIVAYSIAMVYQAVLFSNRVAGPIYRVHKILEAMREGDLSIRMKLRDKDYLWETADHFNRTLEVLESRYRGAPAGVDRQRESQDLPVSALDNVEAVSTTTV